MIYIPKKILKKLKLQKVEEIEVEEARAIENIKRFNKSMEVIDKVGKEIGEMREWAPYCNDTKTYMPFPIDILTCNKQQMLQLLIHAYGTAQYLKDELDKDNNTGL
jgi:bifunctional DNA-binding transcriptional regulator/antitoxin component of YhaV-PrlF toxin-antitoxin module